jgi:hypothetical protein
MGSVMKVSELIEQLQQLDGDRLVVLSSDGEGNSFRKLGDFSTAMFDPEEREIGLEVLTEELKQAGYSDEDVMEDGEPAVVLWP